MKLFGKNRDRAIDTLLRAHVSRRSGVSQTCPEFDPDLVSAYVEGRLTIGLHSRYEEHLSGCAACRKSVVSLSRIAMSDLKPARTGGVKVREVFGVLSRPQWALAAAAIIVFVVSLPLLLSRSPNKSSERTSSVTEQVASDSVPTADPRANVSNQVSITTAAKPHEERNDKSAPAASRKSRTIAATGSQERLEARSDSESTDEVKQKSDAQAASQVAAAAAPESQEAKSDSEKGRQQQQKDSAQSGESKGRAQETAGTEKARQEATPAPPPASRAKGLKPAGKLALRENATSESVRPAERKIVNKRFLWKDGAWTDKEFDPDKGLPVVAIIRASNVYNEVLNKHAGLKRYLDVLPETDRAIIVYKGTVYKLIPQQN